MRIKIFRLLVCLVVIFAMVVNVSPIRAEASAGALLGPIAGVASVNIPAALGIGAVAIALGVMAGTNDDFVEMVDYVAETATDWVKDGTVELLRVVDATGKVAYYAADDMLEDLRSWLFDSGVVTPGATLATTHTFGLDNEVITDAPTIKYAYRNYNRYFYGACSLTPFRYIKANGAWGDAYTVTLKDGTTAYYFGWNGTYTTTSAWYSIVVNFPEVDRYTYQVEYNLHQFVYGTSPSTDLDLNLGHVPSVPIDGSSALDWSEEYAAKRIYVTGGSNDPDPPDENNGKWFWPIALPLTAATLLAMSQADEWSGETPQEFDDYTQNTEFEILDRPEFGEYHSIVIQPVTSPSPDPGGDPDIGGNPDPTAPGEPSPDPDPDPEPDPEPVPDPSTDPDVDPDINPDAGGNGSQNPEPPGVSDYTLDLSDFFPFCIPFDIYDLVQVLDAEPEAPHFVFDVDFPYMEEPWHIDIDFSTWDPVALVLRRLELLLFIVGLAMATRNYYIRG